LLSAFTGSFTFDLADNCAVNSLAFLLSIAPPKLAKLRSFSSLAPVEMFDFFALHG
jgi:hypothetical protein